MVEPKGNNDVVGESEDYATHTFGDPWDMSNSLDLSGWVNYISNSSTDFSGMWSGTANDSKTGANYALIWPIFAGWGDDPTGGTDFYVQGRLGAITGNSINSSKYKKLSFRLYQQQSSYISLGFWENGTMNATLITNQMNITGAAGWKTYDVNLTSLTPDAGYTGGWTSKTAWKGLGIFPSRQVATGNSLQLDWIRLYDPTTSNSFNIQWTASGLTTVKIYYDGDNNYSNGYLGNIASSVTASAGAYLWDTGFLPQGDYYIHVANSTGTIVATSDKLTISSTPIIKLFNPDSTGGEDFAKSQTGNALDMASLDDVKNNTNNSNGNLSNISITSDGMLYGCNNSSLSTELARDPVVFLYGYESFGVGGSPTIDGSRYYLVSFRMQVDGEFTEAQLDPSSGGTGIRFVWHLSGANPYCFQQTKGIINFDSNYYTYNLDLSSSQQITDNPSGCPIAGWTGKTIDMISIHPHEFAAQRCFKIDWVKVAAPDEALTGIFPIYWELSNLATGKNASISLYYDSNNTGYDGTQIVSGLTKNQLSYLWDTSSLPNGTYYIYAVVTDGTNANMMYSSGVMIKGTNLSSDSTKPATINNLAASSVIGGSTNLTFTAPSDNTGGATGTPGVEKYIVKYSTSLITGSNWNSAMDFLYAGTPSTAGVAESITVSGLSDSTTYYFAVRGVDDANNVADISNVASFIVPDPPTITSFTPTSGATGTYITITGNYLSDATEVKFGGYDADSWTVSDTTQIQAKVRYGSSGKITVKTAGGTAISSQDFTYVPTLSTEIPSVPTLGEWENIFLALILLSAAGLFATRKWYTRKYRPTE